MKKLLPLLLFLCAELVYAQTVPITYAVTDVPTAPSILRIAVDTLPLPSVNFGAKGANQFYDFSNLSLYKYDTVEFKTPTNSQTTECPQADVAVTTDGVNFLLTNTTTNKLILEGFQGQLTPGNTITAAYQTKPDIHRFPTNYLGNFNGTASLQKTVSGSSVGQPGVSQVRLTINTTYTDTVDAWGIVKTPVGTYKCLRKQRKETTRTQIEAQVFPPFWTEVSDETVTTFRYSYLTKEAKGSVVSFTYDSANVLQAVNWATVLPTAPVAGFTFAYGSGGLVNFTDTTDNATSWTWNFGDGGTSTQEHPSHTYAANGTYNVCLIAHNAGGSSVQVCKQVTITNAATVPSANFNWTNTTGGTVAFTDQSTGAPTSWSWTFGDGGTSALQNPSHTYTANGNYTVCLTATNGTGSSTQYCETVTVSGIVSAPVAEFAWVNISGGTVNFTDQSTNTPTQWAWTFGDATTSTQQNPTHVYTANNTYNVCLTATNSGGSSTQHCENVVVNGLVAGNNAPVAVTDTVGLTQATSITIYHVATNDIDPDGDNVCLTSVWGSPYVTEYIGGSCDMVSIVPDSNFVGTDTAWYQLCDNGQPILCDTGLIIFTVTPNPALYPTAVNDVATVLQPDGALVNVTANDITPVNPVCVTDIYGGGGAFVISGCNSIDYTPDSLFTGNDTVWYVICDNGHPTWCDTAMLVLTSNANPALLPEAAFTDSCLSCSTAAGGRRFVNASTAYDSVYWYVRPTNFCTDSVATFTTEIVVFTPAELNFCQFTNYDVCIVAINSFGADTSCRNFYTGSWESIHEVSLSGIQLYPNPSQNNITVDMSKNDDDATRNYTAIEIFNAIGEKVKVVGGSGNKLVTISVSELAEGMYMAALLDAKGTRRSLGRFTVAR